MEVNGEYFEVSFLVFRAVVMGASVREVEDDVWFFTFLGEVLGVLVAKPFVDETILVVITFWRDEDRLVSEAFVVVVVVEGIVEHFEGEKTRTQKTKSCLGPKRLTMIVENVASMSLISGELKQ